MSRATDEGADTRTRLLRAAEELFAERGSEAVSLREIGRAAGARNVIAAQYWFTDRDGLVQALLDRHLADIEQRRHAMLDAFEAGPHAAAVAGGPGADEAVHALAAALVEPLAAKLDEGAPGAGYLRTVADLLTRPVPSTAPLALDRPGASTARWRALLEPLLEPEALELHRRFLAIRFVAVEVAQRARSGRDDHRLFVSQLVDAAAGLLGATVSARTRELREQRRSAPR
ncbi:regulatory protein TetR [Pseudonocardia dioxanivorans CB1190]|uniref:Regulatory protein TetR n=1 Tax=Pseudonocardia dioxanivorans (strain ATCC 55486 / DSM 44775 / JCM 13855 / CB1190) TaxID=675635 RepID=F4CT17_PSEUX|nr:helix-turn-helix domain-containing protein [Pseudonocardia dioxanivorans]AEA25316.1 regulatory protein TetR [Pseudonocardia dioxanivorans CB1190]